AVFFFSSRRRHTSSSRDWSSDVCSSDLEVEFLRPAGGYRSAGYRLAPGDGVDQRALANVRTAGEGDLRKVAIGQEVERRGREQELDPAGEQTARFFDQRVGLAHPFSFSRSAAWALSAASFSACAWGCGCFG